MGRLSPHELSAARPTSEVLQGRPFRLGNITGELERTETGKLDGPDASLSSSKAVFWVKSQPPLVLAQLQTPTPSQRQLRGLYEELKMTSLLDESGVGPKVWGAVLGPQDGEAKAMFVERGASFDEAAKRQPALMAVGALQLIRKIAAHGWCFLDMKPHNLIVVDNTVLLIDADPSFLVRPSSQLIDCLAGKLGVPPRDKAVCAAVGCHFACLMLMMLVVTTDTRVSTPHTTIDIWKDALRTSRTHLECAWCGARQSDVVSWGTFLHIWSHYHTRALSNQTVEQVRERLLNWMGAGNFPQCQGRELPQFKGEACVTALRVGQETAPNAPVRLDRRTNCYGATHVRTPHDLTASVRALPSPELREPRSPARAR